MDLYCSASNRCTTNAYLRQTPMVLVEMSSKIIVLALFMGLAMTVGLLLDPVIEGLQQISPRRHLQTVDACTGLPCPFTTHCRHPEQNNQCGVGQLFCNERSTWNSTGCLLLGSQSGNNSGNANGTVSAQPDVGAAVGGVLGALAFVTVGAVVAKKRNWLNRRPPIKETPWTADEISALQRAYDFTKDFDSLCKAVPTKTPAEIAIRVKKMMQPRTMLQRASMLLFAPRESLGLSTAPPVKKKGPSRMVSNFKSSAFVQSPFSYLPSGPFANISPPVLTKGYTSFMFMRSPVPQPNNQQQQQQNSIAPSIGVPMMPPRPAMPGQQSGHGYPAGNDFGSFKNPNPVAPAYSFSQQPGTYSSYPSASMQSGNPMFNGRYYS